MAEGGRVGEGVHPRSFHHLLNVMLRTPGKRCADRKPERSDYAEDSRTGATAEG